MRRTVTILSTISVALAASTAYLAYQLHDARRELLAARAATAPAVRHTSREQPARAPGGAIAPLPAADTSDAGSQRDSRNEEVEAGARAGSLQSDAYMRRLLKDPERRAKMQQDIRANLERELTHLAKILELGEDEYRRLIDLLVAQRMRESDAYMQCRDNPGCDVTATGAAQAGAERRELTELLGAEKTRRFDEYRDNFMERSTVRQFSAELPESLRLSDQQADRLANALGEERRRTYKEWAQRGASAAVMGNSFGVLYFPNDAQGVEQRVAQAREYQRRQRERAAEVLTAGQLEIYTRRQDDMLAVAQDAWEHEAQAQGARSD